MSLEVQGNSYSPVPAETGALDLLAGCLVGNNDTHPLRSDSFRSVGMCFSAYSQLGFKQFPGTGHVSGGGWKYSII